MSSATQDLQSLARQGRARLGVIVDDLMERQLREVPEFFVTDDPAYVAAVRRSTHENTELMLDAVGRAGALPHSLGFGPRLEADLAAQHGAHVDALLRTYRLGQQVIFEHVIDDVARGGYDDIRRPADVLRGAAHQLYRYIDRVSPLVAREYADERDRLHGTPRLHLLRRVQSVLAGQPPLGLDYAMEGAHVAIVASGDAAAAIARVADDLGADHLAVLEPSGDRTWGWMQAGADDEVAARVRREGLDGVHAGVGGPCLGVSGFRLAHRQALVAWQVADARGGGVVAARDAMVEALALGDQDLARELVRAELGLLAGPDERSVRLRTTLGAWFDARESVSATAAALEIAPRTVTYRLRRAESLLGHAIAERRAEIETALRLQRLFESRPPRS